jgi:hypothetical protein
MSVVGWALPTLHFRLSVKLFSLVISIVGSVLIASATNADDFAVARRLGVSLATLQKNLEKVAASVVFSPRPGSAQGTQEARLPNKAGVVQASGDQDNVSVVVLWLPIDRQNKRIGLESRGFLNALVRTFISDSEPVTLWLEQVLQRALTESESGPHLESQLFDTYQLKANYVPSMTPPMLSLTLMKSVEE